MKFRRGLILAAGLWIAAAVILAVPQEEKPVFNESLLQRFTFRGLGPYRAGSWITDFAVPESPHQAHLYTFYVGTRNGGVWRTVNNGTTFTPIFDEGHDYLSIGALALAPSNPDILWVGTGEAYCARSSHRGDGVYKSANAGRTWECMGLRDSHHIARIVIHPTNPDVVYVAAMGHLFTANEERGLFKTTDGGRTWTKVLYVNDKVGVIDLVMNRSHPEILYAATYEKYRYPWHFEEGGPESGISKSTDGGETWQRLGQGLPTGKIGRIGLDIYRRNPDILYAVIENATMRPPTDREAEQDKRRGLEPEPRLIGSALYRTDDAGATWRRTSPESVDLSGKAAYSFNQIRIDPNDDRSVYLMAMALMETHDSGATWLNTDWPPATFANMFGDVRTLWIDPENSDRMLVGSDGGVNVTYDRGKTVEHLYNIPLGEFYAVGADMEDPYNLYGGLQDHGSWKGPSNGWSGEVTLSEWITVGEGDGMYNCIDPEDSRWVYNCREFGSHRRIDRELGTITDITPRRAKGKVPYRFNWTPPIHISPHNSRIIYTGAQVLLRSMHRGDNWQEASPDLTLNDPVKTKGRGNITYCTITTIAESPVKPGLIWVGTDDGKVWVTRDAGVNWREVTQNIVKAGGPQDYWVSRVHASPHAEGTAFVSKTGFRNDDSRPFLFKTTDFGLTWTAVVSGLADFPVNVVVQDRKNPDLLIAGTDGGVFVSLSGGRQWMRFKANMPSAPVKDLLIHPRENDLVAATYGRGLYLTDITPLQELSEKVLSQDAFLFQVEPRVQRVTAGWGDYRLLGDKHLFTPNEPDAVVVNYYLKSKAKETPKITVTDPYGEAYAVLEAANEPGLNTVLWNMRRQPMKDGKPTGEQRWWTWPRVEPGEYVVRLEVAGKIHTAKALIRERRGWSLGPHSVRID